MFKYEVWCVSVYSELPPGGASSVLSIPRLWPSAQITIHEQLLSPPVDESCMPWLLTSGSWIDYIAIVGDILKHHFHDILMNWFHINDIGKCYHLFKKCTVCGFWQKLLQTHTFFGKITVLNRSQPFSAHPNIYKVNNGNNKGLYRGEQNIFCNINYLPWG